MAQKLNNTYVGTELKMHIGFSYRNGEVTLDDLNGFSVDFFCDEGRVQHFEKSQLIYEDKTGEYYACVDTKITGPGILKMKLTADIYEWDGMYGNDMLRTEVAVCTTNVRILDTYDR